MCTPFNFEVFTDRIGVSLLPFIENDAEPLYRLLCESREHLRNAGEWMWDKYRTLESIYDITHFPKRDRTCYGIWHDDAMVGYTSVKLISDEPPVISYWTGARFVRRGYASSAARALALEAFGLGYREVLAVVSPENIPSKKCLERAGFTAYPYPTYAIPGAHQVCYVRKADQSAKAA